MQHWGQDFVRRVQTGLVGRLDAHGENDGFRRRFSIGVLIAGVVVIIIIIIVIIVIMSC